MTETSSDFEKFIETLNGHPEVYRTLRRLAVLHSEKNTDYAAGGPVLGNFERTGHWLQYYNLKSLIDTNPALFQAIDYMLKQLDAVLDSLGKGRKMVVEDVPKKIDDIVLYWIIARVLYMAGGAK